ncbi:MAG: putative signal transducing protein [Alphaproteobacteria bacterium]
MRELFRTNDPVKLSWLEVLLRDRGIETVIFDTHTSIIEGSAGAILRRMMVLDEDYGAAYRALRDANETPSEDM